MSSSSPTGYAVPRGKITVLQCKEELGASSQAGKLFQKHRGGVVDG